MHPAHQPKPPRRHWAGCGNGQDPCPHDAPGDAPAHGRYPIRRAHAHDRPRDGMGGADRNPGQGRGKQGDCARRLRAESPNRPQLGDARPHGVHDAPAAEIRPQSNGGMRCQDDGPVKGAPVVGHIVRAHVLRAVQRAGHDAHGLLRVVAAVTQAVGGGGKQLQLAEPAVDALRRLVAQQPEHGHHEGEAQNQPHDRRHHDEDQRLVPARHNNHVESRPHDGSARHQVSRSHTIAPISPAITTYWVIESIWTIPLPMVLATAVPRKNAATKLKNAAQTTASLGESTRVETTVAMLFAASWKPLRKSNVSATRTVMMSRRRFGLTLALPVFEDSRPQAFFSTTVSSTSATSSALSVAVSRNSSSSLVLMRVMGSCSLSNRRPMATRDTWSASFSRRLISTQRASTWSLFCRLVTAFCSSSLWARISRASVPASGGGSVIRYMRIRAQAALMKSTTSSSEDARV